LLASPHYGERWGRHWLDVVHYGDTHGYDKDKKRVNAWPYRDYVIAAFNNDLPYGRFIREQVAGDVIWPVLIPDARLAIRAAVLQQLQTMVLDGIAAGVQPRHDRR
jgi:hypothetical protein